MKTAIVILNWNGAQYLQQFLPILIANTQLPETEIIVADNASSDNSIQLLTEQFPSIRTIILDKNYGFAGGYNKALEQVKSDYYVLLNSDVEVSSDWLNPLIDYLDNNTDVAACQPKILSYYNRNQFEHAGAAGGFIDCYGFPYCRGRIFDTVEQDNAQYNNIIDIFWATGACLVIRAEMYWKVGGLDNEFFAHMEEIDLCWRLKSRSNRIVCVPQSTVYHIGGGTLNVENPRKTYLNFRNNLLLLYKNVPTDQLTSRMVIRYFFDYLAVIQFLVKGKFANARSVIKARRDFRRMKPQFLSKRNENILYSTCLVHKEMLNESIILKYFLSGVREFSKL